MAHQNTMPTSSRLTKVLPGQMELFANIPPALGTTFNPAYEACGFFPGEEVKNVREARGGAQSIYQHLIRSARGTGRCFFSSETLGALLGVTGRQAGRYRQKLEECGLIRTAWHKGEGLYEFEFLFHPAFKGLRTIPGGTMFEVIQDEYANSSLEPADWKGGAPCYTPASRPRGLKR